MSKSHTKPIDRAGLARDGVVCDGRRVRGAATGLRRAHAARAQRRHRPIQGIQKIQRVRENTNTVIIEYCDYIGRMAK